MGRSEKGQKLVANERERLGGAVSVFCFLVANLYVKTGVESKSEWDGGGDGAWFRCQTPPTHGVMSAQNSRRPGSWRQAPPPTPSKSFNLMMLHLRNKHPTSQNR